MKKYFSSIIIIISLFFAFYYLKEKSLLDLSTINVGKYFVLSLIFLFGGFVMSAMSWWYAVKIHNIKASVNEGITSHGLSIFAKYIPGKVWTILGRASKISMKHNLSVSELSFISLKEQLVYLLSGLIVSVVPVYLVYGLSIFFIFVLLSAIGLMLIIFNKHMHSLFIFMIRKIIKKEPELPLINVKEGFKLSIFSFILWLMWSTAFYFLGLSFSDKFSMNLGFAFPVSVVYGVLALIMPGGIGVREGILIAYLTFASFDIETATYISISSRLWFFSGEVFLFLFALVFQINNKVIKDV